MAPVNMFEPVTVGSIQTRNRICIPPMVIYHISDESGMVKPQNVEHYRALARGGAGLIIQEATLRGGCPGISWGFGPMTRSPGCGRSPRPCIRRAARFLCSSTMRGW